MAESTDYEIVWLKQARQQLAEALGKGVSRPGYAKKIKTKVGDFCLDPFNHGLKTHLINRKDKFYECHLNGDLLLCFKIVEGQIRVFSIGSHQEVLGKKCD